MSVLQAKELASKFVVFSEGGIIVKKRIDLKSFIIKTLKSIAGSENLEYQLKFKQTPDHIEADTQQLKEAFKNIVVNTFEAMDRKGVISIRFSTLEGVIRTTSLFQSLIRARE
jgi:nitrogen fixation/metabolism regulation signal transduction histidine kinase